MNSVLKFEGAIAEYLGVQPEDIICCNNGTAALIATIMSFDIQNQIVVTSPFSFPATTNSILLTNNIPYFCDVKQDGLIDFEQAYNPTLHPLFQTRHWTPPTILYPTLFNIIRVPKRNHFEHVIVDGAQSFSPSELWNEVDAVTFSFYKTKQLSTYEGGAILCKNRLTNERIRAIINQGQSEPWNFQYLGYNFRMPEIIAEIGYQNLITKRLCQSKTMEDGYYPFLITELPYMKEQPHFKGSPSFPVAESLVQKVKK